MRFPFTTRRALTMTAAAAAVVTGVTLTPGAAQASTILSYVYLSPNSSANTLMLDVSGGSTDNGASVIQWYLNGGNNQKWNFNRLPDGNSQIINVNSGKCLTTDGVAGDSLYQFTCVGAASQEWAGNFQTSAVQAHTIRNPWSNLYVDIYGNSGSAGAHADGYYGNGGQNQYFAFYQG